jgi:hypothetical protein
MINYSYENMKSCECNYHGKKGCKWSTVRRNDTIDGVKSICGDCLFSHPPTVKVEVTA